jgi:hypothetical protein
MEPCPVCLFRPGGAAWLCGHPDPPQPFSQHSSSLWRADQDETSLFGATQYRLNGIWTAVADYSDPARPPEDILSELFHEMHHVHQRNNMPHKRWEDPGMLVTYPEQVTSEVLKAWEGRLLIQAILSDASPAAALSRYGASRNKRLELIGPKALSLEGRVETMEGPALYCQARCLKELEGGEWPTGASSMEVHGSLLRPLLHPSWGRDGFRLLHMARGLAIAMLLDRLSGESWKQRLFNGEMLMSDLLEEHVSPFDGTFPDLNGLRLQMSALGDGAIARRSGALESFRCEEGILLVLDVPAETGVVGMDPMSATAVKPGLVLHPRLLRLEVPQGGKVYLEDVPALAKVDGSVWSLSRLMFHIPGPECMQERQGRLIINLPGLTMEWPSAMARRGRSYLSLL